MFIPTTDCIITLPGTYDEYGQPQENGASFSAKCSIIQLVLKSTKTSVRADAAATRGSAVELEAQTELMFGPEVDIQLDYFVDIAGARVRIVGINRAHDVLGRFDHYEVTCNEWSTDGG